MFAKALPIVMGLISAVWIGMIDQVLMAIDPFEAGSSAERLGTVGLLVAGIVVLVAGIGFLYIQQSKAWRQHHEDTVERMNKERQERDIERREHFSIITELLRESTKALEQSSASTNSLRNLVETILKK